MPIISPVCAGWAVPTTKRMAISPAMGEARVVDATPRDAYDDAGRFTTARAKLLPPRSRLTASDATTPDPAPRPNPGGRGASLTVRLAVMLTLALLPIGLIAVFQSLQSIDRAQSSYRASLSGQTFQAALPEGEAIVGAFNLARGLAHAMPSLLETPDACAAAMRRAAEGNPRVTFIGFVDTAMRTDCNSVGRTLDFSDNPQTERAFAAGEPDVSFIASGSESQTSVIAVSEPVRTDAGDLLGFIALSVPSTPLEEARAQAQVDDAVTLVTFNGAGEILTSDLPRDDIGSVLPNGMVLADFVGGEQRVFTDENQEGQQRDFALVPILPGKAYALGSWATPSTGGIMGGAFVATSVLFPILMWAASVVVSILALRRLVMEPVRVLRMRMRSFADGRRVSNSQSMAVAPREFQEISETFEKMAYQIAHDEADLEDRVHERDILLREVHHRVKNNLQLMSSIINMQIRQSEGSEAEDALRRIQGRLASLAKFHQDLYETSSLSRLRADQLLEDLGRQMVSMSADPMRQVDLRFDFDEVVLVPDQASPLAMLVTEALTNALKYAGADAGEETYIVLSLKSRDDGAGAVFMLENSLASDAPPDVNAGLGTKLITAFASQLGAYAERERESNRYILRVDFDRVTPEADDLGTKSA
ncbi:MAG: histidine kinase dimerization/phosphoacceptor domain -containing protein [Pseudomonadota bacterium]